jgi:hypothetical protein
MPGNSSSLQLYEVLIVDQDTTEYRIRGPHETWHGAWHGFVGETIGLIRPFESWLDKFVLHRCPMSVELAMAMKLSW